MSQSKEKGNDYDMGILQPEVQSQPGPPYGYLPPTEFSTSIFQGKQGHYFKSYITGYGMVTFQLVDWQNTPVPIGQPAEGIASINIINPNGTTTFIRVSNKDFTGLSYLGPVLPYTPPPQTTPPQGTGGGGTGGGSLNPLCAMFPHLCRDGAHPRGYYTLVPVFVPYY